MLSHLVLSESLAGRALSPFLNRRSTLRHEGASNMPTRTHTQTRMRKDTHTRTRARRELGFEPRDLAPRPMSLSSAFLFMVFGILSSKLSLE